MLVSDHIDNGTLAVRGIPEVLSIWTASPEQNYLGFHKQYLFERVFNPVVSATEHRRNGR